MQVIKRQELTFGKPLICTPTQKGKRRIKKMGGRREREIREKEGEKNDRARGRERV